MDNIGIFILIASFCGICWRVYHIGWDEGYERGIMEGVVAGFTSEPEIYEYTDEEDSIISNKSLKSTR